MPSGGSGKEKAIPVNQKDQKRTVQPPTISGFASHKGPGAAGGGVQSGQVSKGIAEYQVSQSPVESLWSKLTERIYVLGGTPSAKDLSYIGASVGAYLGALGIDFNEKAGTELKAIHGYYKKEFDLMLKLLKSDKIPASARKILEERLLSFVDDLIKSKKENAHILAQYILKDLREFAPKKQDALQHHEGFNQEAISLRLNGDYSNRLAKLLQLLSQSRPDSKAVDASASEFMQSLEQTLLMQSARETAGDVFGESIHFDFHRKLAPYMKALSDKKISVENRKILEGHILGLVDNLMQDQNINSVLLVQAILYDLRSIVPEKPNSKEHHGEFNLNFVGGRLENLGEKMKSRSASFGAGLTVEAQRLQVISESDDEMSAAEIAAKQQEKLVEKFNAVKKEFDEALAKISVEDLTKSEKLKLLDDQLDELKKYCERDKSNELQKIYEECRVNYARVFAEKANDVDNLDVRLAACVNIKKIYAVEGLPDSSEFKPVREFMIKTAEKLIPTRAEDAKGIYAALGFKDKVGDIDFRNLGNAVANKSSSVEDVKEKFKALAENKVWLAQSPGGIPNSHLLEGYFLNVIKERCLNDDERLSSLALISPYLELYKSSPQVKALYRSLLDAFATNNKLQHTEALLNWVKKNDNESHDVSLQFNALILWLADGKSLSTHPAVKNLNDPQIAKTIDSDILNGIISAAVLRLKPGDVPAVIQLSELLYGRSIINPVAIDPQDADQLGYLSTFINVITNYDVFMHRKDEVNLLSQKSAHPFDDKFQKKFLKDMESADPVVREKISQMLYVNGKRLLNDPRLLQDNQNDPSKNILVEASRYLQAAARLGNYNALKELAWSKDPAIREKSTEIMKTHYSKIPTLRRMNLRRIQATTGLRGRLSSMLQIFKRKKKTKE